MLLDYMVSEEVRVIADGERGVVLCIAEQSLSQSMANWVVAQMQEELQTPHIIYIFAENEMPPHNAFVWENMPNTLSNSAIKALLEHSLGYIKELLA